MTTLQVSNGAFVCAEQGGGSVVVANRAAAGPWEEFDFVLQDRQWAIKAHDGTHYLTAEITSPAPIIVANRSQIGAWELFDVEVVSGGIALKAANGKYVCAEAGGGRELVANRSAVGPWETFSAPGFKTEDGAGPGPIPTLRGRLRSAGKNIVDASGRIFRAHFASFLNALDGKEYEAQLDQIAALGFNGVRVFAGALHWANVTADQAKARLPQFIDACAKRGLYVIVTALTDTKN